MPRPRQVAEVDSPLVAYQRDGNVLGLSGKPLAEYIEKRRLEELEEKKRKDNLELEERRRREALQAEERRIAAEREDRREERDFELRRIELQNQAEGNRNQNARELGNDASPGHEKSIKLKLPYLDDKDDLEAYFRQFERVAKISKWDDDDWGARLGCQLKGKAREAYARLSDEEAKVYNTVKAAILEKFQLTSEAYRKKFRGAKKEAGESAKEGLTRIQLYFDRWVELAKREGKAHEPKSLIIMERFLEWLPFEQARFVRERNPINVDEALKHARVYEESRESEHRRAIPNPPKTVHNQPNGGSKPPANVRTDNFRFGNASEGQRSGPSGCFLCGGPHLARQCPKSKPNNKPSSASTITLAAVDVQEPPTVCEKCCNLVFEPQCEATVEGKTVRAIRDTGASAIIVDSEIVPREKYTGEAKRVVLADSRVTRELPIAEVEMRTPFFSGITKVLVMDRPVHPVLIGNVRTDSQNVETGVPLFRARAETCAPVVTRQQEAKSKEKPVKVIPKETLIGQIKPDDLKAEQRNDPDLVKARAVADQKIKTGTRYVWKKDILYRVYSSKDTEYKQVVVPKKFRDEVMGLAHDSPMSGHLGARKTRDRIWRDFFWPGICGDVRRYCASCDACQRSTPKGATRKVPLQKVPLMNTPFERVGVDIIGPILPASARGHRYILTMIDHATRYAEAVPLKDISSETVADALFEMWTRFGLPKEVLTDQGGQFVGGYMTEVNRLLGVKGLRTSPFHAQTNGLTEKLNSTLKSMMKRMCQEQPKEWDKFIPALLFAYREVPQESLMFSPFELLYGREVRGPMQVLRQIWTDDESSEELRTTIGHIVDLSNKIEQTCTLARENLSKASLRHARAYDKNTRQRHLAKGDKVLILLPVKHNKLQLTWKGPYKIVDRVGSCNYRVQMGNKVKVYHANLLKLYVERTASDVPDGAAARSAEPAEEEVAIVMHEMSDSEDGGLNTDKIPLIPLAPKEKWDDVVINAELSVEKQKDLRNLCRSHQKALSDMPGSCQLEECEIKLSTSEPVRVKQYPIPHSQRETIKKEVQTMEKMGVIEPSVSPYSSPVVLTQKRDGTVRFCIDYRKLNKVTEFDSEPIPDAEQIFARLQQAEYFSKLDLSKGYWQVGVKEKDRAKTSFSTPGGQYQWTKMPFGLKTASAIFTRCVRKLLDPLGREDVEFFMDDILIATKTWEQHLEALNAVLARLEEVGLTAKPSKCHLGFRELDYLGHRIGHGKISPDDDKTEKIRRAEKPRTKKEVRSFLGLAGYYRKFVPDFARVSAPLTDLTKKDQPEKVVWTKECETAFTTLKQCLTSKPILILPDNSKQYVLRTDASNEALGAVLLQEQGGNLHPVAYASKKLNSAERNYSTIEKECLGVVWGVKRFEQYLYAEQFVIETDHQPLQYLQKSKTENGRLMRWALQLQQHSFTLKVIPGKDNVGADFLSRANYQ
ncbi:uncharacterized protein [Littorina saxatilis]|uniref:uncharacterized protein n=1 Tax=Littorina saxatilis TaxID=31220 RepID=UPI0038B500D6